MSDTEREETTDAEAEAEAEAEADPDLDSEATTGEADSESEEASVPDESAIAERVADADPETVASEIAALREENESLSAEVGDLESRLKRKQAEFQNYKKRQQKRREQERQRATEDLVESLLEVRDNLNRALEQDDDADIREGVEATFRQLDDILKGENVDPIEPDPGTEVDPKRHEVLLKVESDQPAGTVAEVHRSGYAMAGKVLRAAQVTVAEDGE